MTYYLLEHGDHMQYGSVRRNGGWLSGAFGVHTTESITDFEGVDPNAENIAAFISRRYQTQRDYGSYHIVADYDSIVDLMPAAYEAWADTTNNPHALSVSGALQAARWKELTPERRRAIVTNMARAAAMKARQAVNAGLLKRMPPARRITAQQAISGSADGFYGHGETNPGTRYDPGKDFDWNLFLSEYAKAAGTGITTASASKPVALDPIEEIMSWYKSKEEFEAAIAHAPNAYKGSQKRDAFSFTVNNADEAAHKTVREHIRVTDTNGKIVDAQLAAFIGTIWKQVHRNAPKQFKEIVARLGSIEAMLAEVADGGDLAAVTEASKAGALAALQEWERDNVQEIAIAVVDEQAERLAPKEEAK